MHVLTKESWNVLRILAFFKNIVPFEVGTEVNSVLFIFCSVFCFVFVCFDGPGGGLGAPGGGFRTGKSRGKPLLLPVLKTPPGAPKPTTRSVKTNKNKTISKQKTK